MDIQNLIVYPPTPGVGLWADLKVVAVQGPAPQLRNVGLFEYRPTGSWFFLRLSGLKPPTYGELGFVGRWSKTPTWGLLQSLETSDSSSTDLMFKSTSDSSSTDLRGVGFVRLSGLKPPTYGELVFVGRGFQVRHCLLHVFISLLLASHGKYGIEQTRGNVNLTTSDQVKTWLDLGDQACIFCLYQYTE